MACKRTTWEYRYVPSPSSRSPEELEHQLNKEGANGWELVLMLTAPGSSTYRLLLKRPAE
jgi:hypothetical protein